MAGVSPEDLEAAASTLRALVAEIRAGTLGTPTPQDVAHLRRIEGALVAMDALIEAQKS